jgi:hypothetical protein
MIYKHMGLHSQIILMLTVIRCNLAENCHTLKPLEPMSTKERALNALLCVSDPFPINVTSSPTLNTFAIGFEMCCPSYQVTVAAYHDLQSIEMRYKQYYLPESHVAPGDILTSLQRYALRSATWASQLKSTVNLTCIQILDVAGLPASSLTRSLAARSK